MSKHVVEFAMQQPENVLSDYNQTRNRLSEWALRQAEMMPHQMDVEQAKQVFYGLNLRSQLHADGEHLTRFLMGMLALRVKITTQHGGDVIGKMCRYYRSQGYQIHENTLRYYVAAARKFGCNVQLFDRYLKTGKTPKRQYDIIEITRAHEDPEVLGAEEFNRVIENQVIRAAEKTSKLTDPVQRHEVELILTQEAEEIRIQGINEDDYMIGVVREPPGEFWDFVGLLNCMACGSPPPVDGKNDPHHVDQGGAGMKGSDWTVIPLCRKCHTLAESVSMKEFERKTGIHQGAAVGRILHLWLSGQDVPSLTTAC